MKFVDNLCYLLFFLGALGALAVIVFALLSVFRSQVSSLRFSVRPPLLAPCSLLSAFCILALALPVRAQTNSWRQSEHALALLHGTNIVWQIVADPAQGKPYFHPLAASDGTRLTELRPADHPWHRGLWFSWKFINGLNYWEEDRQTGRSEGATELIDSQLSPHADGSATLKFSLSYHPWPAPALLTEQRTIEISAPSNGCYEIKWLAEFTAVTNVTLSRTPLPGETGGKAYGGYAGLSLRLAKSTRGGTFSNCAGAAGETALHGQPAGWVKYSAGPGLPAVTIFDDPKNLGYPVKWYVNQGMPYFSPSPLFAKPLTLAAGEKLVLSYQIRIADHDGCLLTPCPTP